MTDATPARLRRSEERIARITEWLNANRAAIACERGRLWYEWEFDKCKAGIETSTDWKIATKQK